MIVKIQLVWHSIYVYSAPIIITVRVKAIRKAIKMRIKYTPKPNANAGQAKPSHALSRERELKCNNKLKLTRQI